MKGLQEVEKVNEMNCQLQNDINPIENSGELWTIASHVQTVKLPRDSTGVRDDGLSITCKYCTNLVIYLLRLLKNNNACR